MRWGAKVCGVWLVASCGLFSGAGLQASAPTATTLGSLPPRIAFGQPVTLSASVSPSQATGTVTFYDGINVVGITPVQSGTATIRTETLSFGSRTLRARYNGDGANAPSQSGVMAVQVVVGPESGFNAPALLPSGMNPEGVAAGDFNGDGILDLAVPNAGDGTVSVLLGTGNGAFGAKQDFITGGSPYAITVADFNGDGIADLALADTANSQVCVLLGNGDGTFQSFSAFAVGLGPLGVTAADFNGDGRVDLATANFSDGTVSVVLGNGDGTFGVPGVYGAGVGPDGITAADFNGDGVADLAVANSVDNTLTVLIGARNGGFVPGVLVSAPQGPYAITSADFNGDGKSDLAVAEFGDFGSGQGSGVLVLLGNGDGTFHPVFTNLSGTTPMGVAAGDLTGDGVNDVAVVNGSGLVVLAGNGDGTFANPVSYAAGSSPIALTLAGFGSNGLSGLAVANENDAVLALLQPRAGNCTFGLTTPSAALDASAAVLNLTLTTNSPGCAWTVNSDAWLAPGTASGLAGGTVGFQAQANTTGSARTGSISIGGQTVTIQQQGTVQAFSDVVPTAYYFDAVDLLKQEGVTAGCSPSQYCPTANITRAQMAIFIVRSVYGGDGFTASPNPYFSDVQPSDFGFPWVQKMYELGVTSGCGAGIFCPNSAVTRDQMAVFVVRARLGSQAVFTAPTVPYFTDVPASYWAFSWIQRMKSDGLTSGCGASMYCPGNAVTRGDMALFLMRGAFNQLLPVGTPMLTQVTPNAIPRGQTTTVTVTGQNTGFAAGQTQILPIPGVAVGTVTVTGPGTLSVLLTPDVTAAAQPVSIVASTGTQEAVAPNGLIIQ